MYELHDQKDDAVDCRYSIFKNGEVILLFNVVPNGLTAEEVFIRIAEYEGLCEEIAQNGEIT